MEVSDSIQFEMSVGKFKVMSEKIWWKMFGVGSVTAFETADRLKNRKSCIKHCGYKLVVFCYFNVFS